MSAVDSGVRVHNSATRSRLPPVERSLTFNSVGMQSSMQSTNLGYCLESAVMLSMS